MYIDENDPNKMIPFLLQQGRFKPYHYVCFIFVAILAPILLILKLVLLFIAIILVLIFMCPLLCCRDTYIQKKSTVRYIRVIFKIFTFLLLCIFHVIPIVKKKDKKCEIKTKVIVCNHVSSLDAFIHYYLTDCTFLSKIEVSKIFLVGSLLKLMDLIYVDRKSRATDFESKMIERYHNSSKQPSRSVTPTQVLCKPVFEKQTIMISPVTENTTENSQPQSTSHLLDQNKIELLCSEDQKPIVIFPEGTCCNQQQMLTFKTGAFRFNLDIQPVSLKYYSYFNCSMTVGKAHIFLLLINPLIVVRVHYLNVMQHDDYLSSAQYAQSTQEAIADDLQINISPYKQNDFVYFHQNNKKQKCLLASDYEWMSTMNNYKRMCKKKCKNPRVQWNKNQLGFE